MKLKTLFAACLLSTAATAQTASDPIIMIINGQSVPRSEFEYSYNKNNSEGVIDKKSVKDYVDLFINYKLKVFAALDAHYDTLQSYRDEFAQYRDQQVRPLMVTDEDIEKEARKIYDRTAESIGPDGLVKCAHILLRAKQQAPQEEWDAVRVRIDSVHQALLNGADFAELAKKVSQDGSAQSGGELPYVQRGQLIKEFEDALFALKDSGDISPVVQTAFGYHVIKLLGRKQFEPFEYHHDDIIKFIEKRNLRDNIAEDKVNAMIAADSTLTKAQIMEQKAAELSQNDQELKYLIQEYHDGLLLYEISNRLVWDKAAKDEEGLARYFKKHKKNYQWDSPRYKGMAYHVKEQADVQAVADCVKNLPFDKWAEALRTTFNADSVIRIRVEKGIFKEGDNALIDSIVFKKDTIVKHLKDYPIDAVYGKILKKAPEDYTDVRGLVVADLQEELEKAWVAELRRKYTWTIDDAVLKTVNNHE